MKKGEKNFHQALKLIDIENNFNGSLLSAKEFINSKEDNFSRDLKNEFLKIFHMKLSAFHLNTLKQSFPFAKYLILNAAFVLIFILHLLFFGQKLFAGILPGQSKAFVREKYKIFPEGRRFLRGSKVNFKIEFYDKAEKKIISWEDRKVYFHYEDESISRKYRIEKEGFTLRNLNNDFTVYFSVQYSSPARENFTSERIKIRVYNPGSIVEVRADVFPPNYLKDILTKTTSQGEISALSGSVVKLKAVSNNNLSSAYIQFYRTGNSGTLEKDGSLKMRVKEKSAQTVFTVKNTIHYKILAKDISNRNVIPSVLYSIHSLKDSRPVFRIGGDYKVFPLPELGKISPDLSANDDFSLEALFIIATLKNRVLFFKQIFQNLKANKQKTLNSISQKINIDLKKIDIRRGEILSLYFLGRDNYPFGEKGSLWKKLRLNKVFPENFPTYILATSKLKGKGQWGISKALKLAYLSEKQKRFYEKRKENTIISRYKEVIKNQKWIDKNIKYIKKKIKSKRIFTAKDKESLKDLQTLSRKNKEELKRLRKIIKKSLAAKNYSQQRKKNKVLSDLEKALEKQIKEKEARLRRLNEKLGMSYKEVYKNLELLDDENYIKSLENSIKALENLILEKKISDISKSLEKLEKEQRKNIENSLAADSKKNKEKISAAQKQITEGIKNAEKMTKDLLKEKLLKQGKLAEILSDISGSENWTKAKQDSLLSEKLSASAPVSSSYKQRSVRKNILLLKRKIDRLQMRFASSDIEKALKELRKTSFQLIEINKILNSEFNKLPAHISSTKKGQEDKKAYVRMARLLAHLRDSMFYSVNQLYVNAKTSGLISPVIKSNFEKIKPLMADLKTSLETFNTYSSARNMNNLESSVNRNIALLLKYISALKDLRKKQAKAMAGLGNKQKRNKQMQLAKSLSKVIGRKKKGSTLSKEEREYIKELLNEEKNLFKNTKDGSSDNKRIAALQKKLQKLRQALYKKENPKWKEKAAELKKEFIKYKQAEKQKGRQEKRESEQVTEEFEIPKIKKLSPALSQKERKKYWNEKKIYKKYSPEEILFYKYYLRGF